MPRKRCYSFITAGLILLLTPVPTDAQADAESGTQQSDKPLPPPWVMPKCLELIQQERYEAARELIEPVVADHPKWPRANFYLALTWHKQNRYEEAERYFARVLELNPDYKPNWVFYGWCLYNRGKPDQAKELFERFLEVQPDYADAIFALGLIDYDADRVDSARKRFHRAIEISAKENDAEVEAKARARLADVLIRERDLPAAKVELEKSIELNPDNYAVYFKLANVLQRLGDAEGAKRMRKLHDEVRERVRPSGDGERPPVD